MKKVIAIDLGASSGRLILVSASGGKISFEEMYRFKNEPVELNGRLYWDFGRIYNEILNGLNTVSNSGHGDIDSIGIDTWGVDYVLFDRIEANPLEPTVQAGVDFGREHNVDFVIGLGGGSVMDSAKAIAAMIPQQGGRVWDYMATGTGDHRPFNASPLPTVAITTSAGTGSEVDGGSVITSPVTHEKAAFFGPCPVLSVVR